MLPRLSAEATVFSLPPFESGAGLAWAGRAGLGWGLEQSQLLTRRSLSLSLSLSLFL